MTGVLFLAATPIGDPSDASARLVALLGQAGIIAAEDTRRLHRLCRVLDVRPAGRVLSYHEHNEEVRTAELLEALDAGSDVILVSDAGMPAVSDPGYRLVRAAAGAGIRVSVIPGPSAVLAAVAVSGLPTDRFSFEGFLPRRAGERAARLGALLTEVRTMVFFESPHRLGATLAAMANAFGPSRQAVVCRELTKTHEEVVRGTLADLVSWAADGVRGEITVVVAGEQVRRDASAPLEPSALVELARLVADREAAGEHRKEAITAVARFAGLPRRTVFDAVVAARRAG
jgi:16S rRNA (cytidine1402-2'-O)-methyltransferase